MPPPTLPPRQVPAAQTALESHALQLLPSFPQFSTVVPPLHSPLAVQQPEQLLGEQCAVLLPQPASRGSAVATTKRNGLISWVRMRVGTPGGWAVTPTTARGRGGREANLAKCQTGHLSCLSMAPHRVLRVFPDSLRVEQALVVATGDRPFVEATGYCTFADLLDWCEPAQSLGRAPCPPLTARLAVSAAARALPREAFGDYALEPAFARAAVDLFQHLALQGSSPDELERVGRQLPEGRRPRVLFLAGLFRAYRARLKALGLADRGELLEAATERLGREIPPRLRPFRRIEVHHVYDLPPLRLDFLDALARAFLRDFRSFALLMPAAHNPALDPLGDEVLARLERTWQPLGAEAGREAPESAFAPLLTRFFQPGETTVEAPGLDVFSAPGPREEVLELAARVRAQIDAGTPPEEIAVVFRDLAGEAEHLVEALEELGVPARVRLGVPLQATAVGRLALELPRMVDDGFPAATVAGYLESRYAGAVFAGALDPVTLFQEAGIRDDLVGRQGQQGAFGVRLALLAAREKQGSVKQSRVEELGDRVERLLELCRPLAERDTAGALLDAWWGALEGLALFQSLRRHEKGDENTRLGRFVERALARDQAAADALHFLREDLTAAFRDAGLLEVELSRRDFTRWLHEAAQGLNLLPKGPRTGAVELLEARQIAGRHFEHVFVGGLNDGRFPARAPPMPLLSEEERFELNRLAGRPLFRLVAGEAGAALPFRQAEDRLLFALCLAAAPRVTSSCPRFDTLGRELLESPFLTELFRLAPGVPKVTVARVSVPPCERVASEADLRARVALEVLSRPATRLSAPSPLGAALSERFGDTAWLTRARALARIEEERDDFFHQPERPPGRFSGAVELAALDPALQAVLSFDREHPAHATGFSTFGNCHFKGLASQLLRLKAIEGATEEPDGAKRGTFWHQVLQQLLPLLEEKGWRWSELPKRTPEQLRALFDQAIDAAGRQVAPTGHPALWELGRENAAQMLRRMFFSDSRGLPFSGLEPVEAELVFGVSRAAEGWREVVIPPAFEGETPLYLTGKIDRLDAGAKQAGVVDYKSGRLPPTLKKMLLKGDFQLPFYLAAAATARPGAELDAAVLSLGDREARRLSKVLEVSAAELLKSDRDARTRAEAEGTPNLANAAHALARQLKGGDFGARPLDCKYCDFRAVCRLRQRVLPEEVG